MDDILIFTLLEYDLDFVLFLVLVCFTKYINWELSWIIEFIGKGYHFFPFLFDNFRIK